MTDDIVERLEKLDRLWPDDLYGEAAAEIRKQRAELATERYAREQHEQTIRELCDENELLLDKIERLLQELRWEREPVPRRALEKKPS